LSSAATEVPLNPRLATLRAYDIAIEAANLRDPSGLETWGLMRTLAQKDRFFLMVSVLGMWFANNDWFFQMTRMVEAEPFGYFDGWARGHGKSTIGTHAGIIQIILKNPEATIGIFSFNRNIARGFIRTLMRELESNERLKWLFPDIFFKDPRKESPKWSELDGLIVKRTGNPKEATIEAWGLTDSQPTSRHYMYMVFDDVVSMESVNTVEQIEKTTKAWEMSMNLTSDRPDWTTKFMVFGTYYAFDDTYHVMLERDWVKPRIFPATDDGTMDGAPVFLTKSQLDEKKKAMGEYTFQCQMLLDPKPDKSQTFKEIWIAPRWRPRPIETGVRIFIIDPAYSVEKRSDNTAIWDITLVNENGTKIARINDHIVDKMSQSDRAQLVVAWHKERKPKHVFEEETGAASDLAYISQHMEMVNYRFPITPVKTDGVPKKVRIKGLMPWFEAGHVILPEYGICMHKNFENEMVDMIDRFVKREYLRFPSTNRDDGLDSLAYLWFSPKIRVLFPEENQGKSRNQSPKDWDVLRD